MGCVSMRCSLVLSRWYNLVVEGIVGICHILMNQLEDFNADAFEAWTFGMFIAWKGWTIGGTQILRVKRVWSIFNP